MRAALVFTLVLVVGSGSTQQVGDTVIVAAAEIELRDSDARSTTLARGKSVRIEAVEGDILLVSYKGRRGNISASDIAPLSQAVEFYTELLRTEPTAENYRERAAHLVERHDIEAALADCTEAVRLDPSAESFRVRAAVLYGSKRFGEALIDVESALKRDPYDAKILVERGCIRTFMGNLAGAAADFDQAIRLDPGCSDAFGARAGVRMTLGLTDLALADLDKAVRLNPESALHRTNRAAIRLALVQESKSPLDLLSQTTMRREAAADLAVVSNDADSNRRLRSKAWRGLGHIAIDEGQYAEARRCYGEAVAIEPRSGEAHADLAVLYAGAPVNELRDGQKAIELAREACNLHGWQRYESLVALAAAHAERGEFAIAAEHQRRAVDIAPENLREHESKWITEYESGKPFRFKAVPRRPPVEARHR